MALHEARHPLNGGQLFTWRIEPGVDKIARDIWFPESSAKTRHDASRIAAEERITLNISPEYT
ncbi:hypothetical protein ASPCADRAFT_204752 [Aspergillus carbonarius ITEM 5010]|uniref:Uncharacterized protein n=1 Tax=Aspergillus carbonarius (strain ITEM 5010) TaxID=602072 RepID=A0A1R3RX82_ASPC5|nr:hypothetical protein ASPCADRAFT_204752 [Aspergillus carbonarius ITEM 5010]